MRNIIALLALAAAVAAEDKVDSIFKVWDADGDGKLTAEEVPDAGIFAKVDTNKDGTISRAEVAAFLGVKAPAEPAKGSGKAKAEAKKQAKTAQVDKKKTESAPMPAPRTVKERVEDLLRRFDKDDNRKIERKEWQAGEQVFVDWDRSRDGALSVRELTRYVKYTLREAKRRPNVNNFFDLFDMNRDKKVTKSEYDGPASFFRQYDHDKNRVITEQELFMGAGASQVMDSDREFMADGPTPMPKQTLLDRYDKDENGRITIQELGGAESVLARLDKNGDGVLSGSEVR